MPVSDPVDLEFAGALVVVLVSILAGNLFRKVFWGAARSTNRHQMPWRFSLGAIAGLTVLVAGVFAAFRDFPCTAAVLGCWTLFWWGPLARFGEFRRVMEGRSKKEFEAWLAHRPHPSEGRRESGHEPKG